MDECLKGRIANNRVVTVDKYGGMDVKKKKHASVHAFPFYKKGV